MCAYQIRTVIHSLQLGHSLPLMSYLSVCIKHSSTMKAIQWGEASHSVPACFLCIRCLKYMAVNCLFLSKMFITRSSRAQGSLQNKEQEECKSHKKGRRDVGCYLQGMAQSLQTGLKGAVMATVSLHKTSPANCLSWIRKWPMWLYTLLPLVLNYYQATVFGRNFLLSLGYQMMIPVRDNG